MEVQAFIKKYDSGWRRWASVDKQMGKTHCECPKKKKKIANRQKWDHFEILIDRNLCINKEIKHQFIKFPHKAKRSDVAKT